MLPVLVDKVLLKATGTASGSTMSTHRLAKDEAEKEKMAQAARAKMTVLDTSVLRQFELVWKTSDSRATKECGENGENGENGVNGVNGENGVNGVNGVNGKNGKSESSGAVLNNGGVVAKNTGGSGEGGSVVCGVGLDGQDTAGAKSTTIKGAANAVDVAQHGSVVKHVENEGTDISGVGVTPQSDLQNEEDILAAALRGDVAATSLLPDAVGEKKKNGKSESNGAVLSYGSKSVASTAATGLVTAETTDRSVAPMEEITFGFRQLKRRGSKPKR